MKIEESKNRLKNCGKSQNQFLRQWAVVLQKSTDWYTYTETIFAVRDEKF